jgi:hypothetical protein
MSTSIQELKNNPHDWSQGSKGFAKRIGSALGQHIVKNSIQYPVAAIRHEELAYRSQARKVLAEVEVRFFF